jgi:WD40 repeat protein
VFEAEGPSGRVAVKLLSAQAHGTALERFRRESRLLVELGQEGGFVPLLDQGDCPAGPYLVMPLIRGGTLADRLQEGPLPHQEALPLLIALAGATGRAHAKGIVHRDLKPANVLMSARGPLIADLGLGKHLQASGLGLSASLSRTGDMRGTVGYLAPEQIEDAKSVGPAADVFSLGAIAYECLAGRPPFQGATQVDVIVAISGGLFCTLSEVAPATPRWLSRLVAQCLAPTPEQRPPHGEALAALLEVRRSAAIGRRPAAVVAGLVALVVLAGGAAVLRGRGDPGESSASPQPAPTQEGEHDPAQASAWPAECASLQDVPGARLLAVLGDFHGRHGTEVEALAVSPDGGTALSAGLSGGICAWELETGALRWRVHTKPVADLCPLGGGRVLSAEGDELVVRDLRDGRQVVRAQPGGAPRALARLTEQRVLVAAPADVQLWDVARGEVLRRYEEPGVQLLHVSGDVFYAGLPQGGLAVWALSGARVGSVAFGGRAAKGLVAREGLLVGIDDRGHVRGYDVVGGDERYARQVPNVMNMVGGQLTGDDLVWPPGGDALVATSAARIAQLDPQTGAERGWLGPPGIAMRRLALSPDGRRVIAAGIGAHVSAWDVATGEPAWSQRGHLGFTRQLEWGDEGERLYSLGRDGWVRAWDVRTGDERWAFRHEGQGTPVCLESTGDRLWLGDFAGEVWALDPATGARQAFSSQVQHGGVRALLGLESGVLLALHADGQALRLGVEGDVLDSQRLDADLGGASLLALDARRALVFGEQVVYALDLGSLELTPLRDWPGSAFSRHAAAGGGRALLHDGEAAAIYEPGQPLRRLSAPALVRAAVSADGAWGATATAGAQGRGQIQGWDLGSGRARYSIPLTSAGQVTRDLALSPDGRRLAATLEGGTILVWELDPGR